MPVSLSLILLLTAVQQYLLAINAAPAINAALGGSIGRNRARTGAAENVGMTSQRMI
jgi:hypothetical protein